MFQCFQILTACADLQLLYSRLLGEMFLRKKPLLRVISFVLSIFKILNTLWLVLVFQCFQILTACADLQLIYSRLLREMFLRKTPLLRVISIVACVKATALAG